MLTSKMASFEVSCEVSEVNSFKQRYDDSVLTHRRENKVKRVVPEVIETCAAKQLCLNLGHTLTETINHYK